MSEKAVSFSCCVVCARKGSSICATCERGHALSGDLLGFRLAVEEKPAVLTTKKRPKQCTDCQPECKDSCLRCQAVWEERGELPGFRPPTFSSDLFTSIPDKKGTAPQHSLPVFSSERLADYIHSCCAEISEMFSNKNGSYGKTADALSNFREVADSILSPVLSTCSQQERMWLAGMVYMEKHLVALRNKGMSEKEADSRLLDIAVYCLLLRAIRAEAVEKGLV